MRNLLRRLGEMGKTIVVSSHILPELADVCTRVGMIEKGNLIIDDYVQDVMRKAREALLLYVGVTENADKAAALIEQHEGVASVSMNGSTIYVTLKKEVEDYSFLSSLLFDAGYKLTLFREEDINLETAFMKLTKGVQQ